MRRRALVAWGLSIGLAAPACGQAPRLPYSGLYGATCGGGSATGWDRSAGGENPARLAAPGWTFAAAGYAPFGLEGLRVAEGSVVWDRIRGGGSLVYRGMFADPSGDGNPVSTEITLQSAVRFRSHWIAGAQAGIRSDERLRSVETGLGATWRPVSWISLGSYGALVTPATDVVGRLGAGMDAGTKSFGLLWRLSVQGEYAQYRNSGFGQIKYNRDNFETRYAMAVQFHSLLSVYAGWAPDHETLAFGARFGFGEWEIFSAQRRHRTLGGTSLQGIRWHLPANDQRSVDF